MERELRGSADDASGAPPRFPLEVDQPFSRSLLWSMQRAFFEQQGIDAWRRSVVPQYVTTNAFVAHAFAAVVAGFLRDCQGAGVDHSQPVYIVELGGGSGRFAFTFLKKLQQALHRAPLEGARLTYVLTDFAAKNVAFFRSHPALRPFVDMGLLDFAVFDAERDETLSLMTSGATLEPGALKNPLVAVANYFFDTISHDAFEIRSGALHEVRVSLFSAQPEPDKAAPAILGRLHHAFSTTPVSGAYYGDPELEALLRSYEARLPHSTLTIPIGALGCCRVLRRLAGDRLLLLSCDKGEVREDQLMRPGPPAYALHGSFSIGVNYHAVGQYFRNAGGQMLHTAHDHRSIAVVGCLLGGPHPEAARAFEEAMTEFGPDDFYSLKEAIDERSGDLSLAQLLAWLRLARGDVGALQGCLPALRSRLEGASARQKADVERLIEQTWDLYYHLEAHSDLPFQIGTLLFQMREFRRAIDWFQRSIDLFGPDAGAVFNIGLCHYQLRDMTAALGCARAALELDPAHDDARAMLVQLEGL